MGGGRSLVKKKVKGVLSQSQLAVYDEPFSHMTKNIHSSLY